jgi:hypothetical protein
MRRCFGSLVVLAAFIAQLPASAIQSSAAEAQSAQAQTYKVEGTVVNAITGRPIPRALVQWNGQTGQMAVLSGLEGEFAFAGVSAGRTQFMVQKPGHFQGRGGNFNPRSILLNVGPDSTRLDIKLTPEAVVFGHVLGKDGEPVEGAIVRIEKAGGASGSSRYRSAPLRNGQTDEDGNFRIPELPPGQYVVALQAGNVNRRVLGSQSANGSEAYPPVVYYPSADEEVGAEPVNLVAEQHLEINFSITPRPAYKISGTVSAAQDLKQVAPPFFVDQRGQVLFRADEFDQQSGAFTFRAVPAGTYTLRLSAADEAGNPAVLHRRMNVHKDVIGLRLSVSGGIEVPVRIRKEFTGRNTYSGNCSYSSADGKVHTSDCSDFPPLQLSLDPIDSFNVQVRSNWRPPVGDTLLLRGLQPGRYKVHAMGGSFAYSTYVSSLRCGGADLLRDELLVPENGQLPAIEAVVRDDMATVHLLVNADKHTYATVAIFSDQELPQEMGQVRTMSFSADSMLNLPMPPGDYKIFAFADSADIDTNDPEELSLYMKKAAAVTLSPGKTTNVVMDLIRTGE